MWGTNRRAEAGRGQGARTTVLEMVEVRAPRSARKPGEGVGSHAGERNELCSVI